MAKTPFSKLGLKINTQVVQVNYNDQVVEVKQYLPMQQKMDMISTIVNNTLDDNPYYNPARLEVWMTLELIFGYSNISFTDKQKEDILKLYDVFAGEGGLGALILAAIPQGERDYIEQAVKTVVDGVYRYKNSAVGIMEAIATDYSNLNLDATDLQSKIGDPNNLALLKQIMDKLG